MVEKMKLGFIMAMRVAIDFNIKEDKEYSFLVGTILLKLNIISADSGFTYTLKEDESNEQRKIEASNQQFVKEINNIIFLGFAVIVVVGILYYLIKLSN